MENLTGRPDIATPTPTRFLGVKGASTMLDSLGTTDLLSSGTLQLFRSDRSLFSNVIESFDSALAAQRQRMLDMGCGYGALSELLGRSLGFHEVRGIDIDDQRALVARERGVQVSKCNLDEDRFPFPDNHFDFVTTFGVLDHLRAIDNPIVEARRVLRPGGCLAISTTNLGSWVNRIALLLGYQPRNLEVSQKGLFGVHKLYREMYACTDVMNRFISPTLRALEEYLRSVGFVILKHWGARLVPLPDNGSGLFLKMLDRVLSKRASLAVRYIILSKKSE